MRRARTVTTIDKRISVSSAFSFGSRQARTLLSSTEESPVFLEGEVDVDQASSLEKLDDHARRDDGRDTEFHEGTPVRREDDTHPIQRIYAQATTSEPSVESAGRDREAERTRRVRRHDTIQRDLRANQEDEESDRCPSDLCTWSESKRCVVSAKRERGGGTRARLNAHRARSAHLGIERDL